MRNYGWLFLSGGGDENKTAKIDSIFLNRLKEKRILYIPIAKSADQNGYKKSAMWVANKLNNLSNSTVKIFLYSDFRESVDLKDFDAIYIAGGNTYKLLHQMIEYGVLKKITKYIQSGGGIYGASAGAVLMGLDISTYIEEKYLSENIKHNYSLTKGMGIIGDYSVLTHFKDGDEKKIEEYFKHKTNPILAIPEGVAVIVENGIASIIGGFVFIFKKHQKTTQINKRFVI